MEVAGHRHPLPPAPQGHRPLVNETVAGGNGEPEKCNQATVLQSIPGLFLPTALRLLGFHAANRCFGEITDHGFNISTHVTDLGIL